MSWQPIELESHLHISFKSWKTSKNHPLQANTYCRGCGFLEKRGHFLNKTWQNGRGLAMRPWWESYIDQPKGALKQRPKNTNLFYLESWNFTHLHIPNKFPIRTYKHHPLHFLQITLLRKCNPKKKQKNKSSSLPLRKMLWSNQRVCACGII